MDEIVLGALVSACAAQILYPLPYSALSYVVPAPLPAAVPFIGAVSSQFHAQDELGQFTFATAGDNQVRVGDSQVRVVDNQVRAGDNQVRVGDNQVRVGDNQARTEVKTLDGVVRGAYSYVDPTSKLVSVNYVADANGYRVVGANNLPEAPAVPSVTGPEPVQDTPEVMPAKATIKYQTVEAVDAPTPADTQKIELKEKESEVVLPYAAAPAPLVIAPSPDVKTAGIHVLSPYQASNIVVL
uniref:Cuticle protein n=1 Tax=Timema genevievae TaxID=629358 RepID=A0A7R9JT23_TIMGE|nr:unnamed protein product [Timema genevievae]